MSVTPPCICLSCFVFLILSINSLIIVYGHIDGNSDIMKIGIILMVLMTFLIIVIITICYRNGTQNNHPSTNIQHSPIASPVLNAPIIQRGDSARGFTV